MNYNIYFEKLKLISEQINSIINENNIIQQQQMMQQQWMMMQNNLPMNIQPLNIQQSKPDIYYIIFSIPERNRITIHAQNEMTVQELINKFINKIKDEYSADIINKMKFYLQVLEYQIEMIIKKKLILIIGVQRFMFNFNNIQFKYDKFTKK